MSPRVRVIRFARVTEPSGTTDGEIVARVWLDEPPRPAGRIFRSATGWHHRLEDGSYSGLASRHARQDLERQIVLYHLGPLPVAETAPDSGAETKTWFAQAV